MTEFISTVLLEDEGPFKTFGMAFENFYRRVKAQIEGKSMRPDLAYQGCYIDRKGRPGPIFLKDVIEVAHKLGLTDSKGDIIPGAPEPHADILETIFNASEGKVIEALSQLGMLK